MPAARTVLKVALAVFIVATALAALAYLEMGVGYLSRVPYNTDFAAYFAFAWQGWHYGWPTLYDSSVQQRAYADLGPIWFFPNAYPPPIGFLVLPLLPLGLLPAFALWTGLGLAATLGAWWLAAPGQGLVKAAHLSALGAVWATALGLILGQIVSFQALAVVVIWRLLARGGAGEPWAGVVLLVAAVKPQSLLLMPMTLLVAGRLRALLVFAAGALLIVAVTVLLVHPSGLLSWYHRLSEAAADPLKFFVPTNLVLPASIAFLGRRAVLAIEVLLIALAALAARRHRGGGEEVGIAAALVAALLVTPFIHLQDEGMLFIAAWLLLRARLSVWLWPPLGGIYIALLGIHPADSDPWAGPLLLTSMVILLVGLAAMPRQPAEAPAGARDQPPTTTLPRSLPAQ